MKPNRLKKTHHRGGKKRKKGSRGKNTFKRFGMILKTNNDGQPKRGR